MPLPPTAPLVHHADPLADGHLAEQAWAEQVAAGGRPQAHLWHGTPGWAVPRSYTRAAGWAAWQAAVAAAGTPVFVRASGGGLVPQGPGLWNLSVLWPAASASPTESDAVYRAFAARLGEVLAAFDVTATPQAVEGSFCDGRYNLAVQGRKLVGTAQAWRRVAGVPVVLVHAVLVLDADIVALTAAANAVETALGHERRYVPEALTSLATEASRVGHAGHVGHVGHVGDATGRSGWPARLAEALRARWFASGDSAAVDPELPEPAGPAAFPSTNPE